MYIACTGQYTITHLSLAQGNTGDTRVHVTLPLNDSQVLFPRGCQKDVMTRFQGTAEV